MLIKRNVFQFLQLSCAEGMDGFGGMRAGMVVSRRTRGVKTTVIDVKHVVGVIRAVVYAKSE